MAAVKPEHLEKELRPTNHCGRDSVHVQLDAMEVSTRFGLMRWANDKLDLFNRSWVSDIPCLVLITLILFFGAALAGPPLEQWLGNLIYGSIVEKEVQPADEEHGWEIAAKWGAGEVAVAMRGNDRQVAAGASSPTDSPTGGAPAAFNLNWASGVVLLWALLLGFSRWQIKNKQDTLSEAFERKRAANEFIVDHRAELAEVRDQPFAMVQSGSGGSLPVVK